MAENESNQSVQQKPGFFSRLGNRFKKTSGIEPGIDALKTINLPGKGYIEEKKNLLRSNLERVEEFEKMSFDKVLYEWGVTNEEDKKALLKRKKYEIFLGLFLFILGFGTWCFQFGNGSSILIQGMVSLSCLSFMALGVIYTLSAYWRIRCVEENKFLPFVKWITTFGNFPTSTGASA